MAIDVTIGGAAADSYITLAEWQDYWTARGVDLTQHGHDDSHEANLRRAAQTMDASYSFKGYRQYQTQAREWPRTWVGTVDGWPVNPDTIPQAVKDAQAELAYLIHEGADPFANFEGNVARAKAGPVEVEFTGGAGRVQYTAVQRLLRPYLTHGAGQVAAVRG